jgi:hypothetical protein
MPIYALREPIIGRDEKGRSVEYDPTYIGLPGIRCVGEPGACGQIWATSLGRIHQELPEDHPLRAKTGHPVPVAEFRALREDVRHVLRLPAEQPLLPGTDIGFVRVRQRRTYVPAFEWPKVHTILVTTAVLDYLQQHGLTGWRTEPVVLTQVLKGKPPPEMREFVVVGRAGTARTAPQVQIKRSCDVCGRVSYEDPVYEQFEIDPEQWDGSDFFRFGPPFHGYIFVSERARHVLEQSPLDNYELVPVEQFLDERRPKYGGGMSAL